MDDSRNAGNVLKWFQRKVLLDPSIDKSRESPPIEKPLFDFEGFASGGWVLGQREVSDFHAPPSGSPADDSPIREQYAEQPKAGVRLSIFVDRFGALIGRAYFDRGDRTVEDVRMSLVGWESLIKRGRLRKQSSLPMSDEEIYDRIKSRHEWYEYGPEGKEYEPTILEAAQQFAASMALADKPDDSEIDLLTEQILRAYERAKKRQGKK